MKCFENITEFVTRNGILFSEFFIIFYGIRLYTRFGSQRGRRLSIFLYLYPIELYSRQSIWKTHIMPRHVTRLTAECIIEKLIYGCVGSLLETYRVECCLEFNLLDERKGVHFILNHLNH